MNIFTVLWIILIKYQLSFQTQNPVLLLYKKKQQQQSTTTTGVLDIMRFVISGILHKWTYY